MCQVCLLVPNLSTHIGYVCVYPRVLDMSVCVRCAHVCQVCLRVSTCVRYVHVCPPVPTCVRNVRGMSVCVRYVHMCSHMCQAMTRRIRVCPCVFTCVRVYPTMSTCVRVRPTASTSGYFLMRRSVHVMCDGM